MRDRTKDQIELFLIRHGMTAFNREHRYLGKTDDPLSPEGAARLLEAKRRGSYPEVDYVFSSPMKRCLETAGIIYPGQEPVIIPEWEEMDFGVFEGKNHEDMKDDSRYQEWIDSGGVLPFPEGESREEFSGRCVKGYERMREMLSGFMEADGRNAARAALVVHGGTFMALLSTYKGGDYYDYLVSNGEVYRWQVR